MRVLRLHVSWPAPYMTSTVANLEKYTHAYVHMIHRTNMQEASINIMCVPVVCVYDTIRAYGSYIIIIKLSLASAIYMQDELDVVHLYSL